MSTFTSLLEALCEIIWFCLLMVICSCSNAAICIKNQAGFMFKSKPNSILKNGVYQLLFTIFHHSLYSIQRCYLGFMPMSAVQLFPFTLKTRKSYKINFLCFSNVIQTQSVFLTLQILQGRNKNSLSSEKLMKAFLLEQSLHIWH